MNYPKKQRNLLAPSIFECKKKVVLLQAKPRRVGRGLALLGDKDSNLDSQIQSLASCR
jgi:hypothetical protein